MRILHVVGTLNDRMGGAPAAAAHMAVAEAEHGHSVTVAHLRAKDEPDHGALRSLLKQAGVSLEDFAPSGPFGVSSGFSKWLPGALGHQDLLQVHSIFDAPVLGASHTALRRGTPYMVHPHGSLDPFDLVKRRRSKQVLGSLVIRRLLAGAARIVATTCEEQRRLNTFGAMGNVIVQALPYKVDAGLLDASAGARVLTRGLFLGRVDYKKGLAYTLDALIALRDDPRNITIDVAGTVGSPYARGLVARASAVGLSDRLNFVGHLTGPEKAAAFKQAGFFVLASDNENYGLVLVEAAAAGLPMILSSEVYLATMLAEAGAARVVDRNGPAIAGSILEVLETDTNAAMSRAAHEMFREHFDWIKVSAAHVALCEAVCR
jgi:glycosyltransferase involved in cell wall biosynthesis